MVDANSEKHNARLGVELSFTPDLFMDANLVVLETTGVPLIGLDRAPEDTRIHAVDTVTAFVEDAAGRIAVKRTELAQQIAGEVPVVPAVLPGGLTPLLQGLEAVHERAVDEPVDVTIAVRRRKIVDWLLRRPGINVPLVRFPVAHMKPLDLNGPSS